MRLDALAARDWPSLPSRGPAQKRGNECGDRHADNDRAMERIRLSVLPRLVKRMGEKPEKKKRADDRR